MIVALWVVGLLLYWIIGIYVAKLFTVFCRRVLNDPLSDNMDILVTFGLLWPAWLALMIVIPIGIGCYKVAHHLPGFKESS